MTVHTLVPQCAKPQERCFELFRMQNSQIFLGLCPWTPLTAPPSDSPAAQWFFSLLCLLKNRYPPKLLDTALDEYALDSIHKHLFLNH